MRNGNHRDGEKVIDLASVKRGRIAEEKAAPTDPFLEARIEQARLFNGRLRELREAVAQAERQEAESLDRVEQAQAALANSREEARAYRAEAEELVRRHAAAQLSADRAEHEVHGLTEAIRTQWSRNAMTSPRAFALTAIGWACALSNSLPTQALGAVVGLIGLGWLAQHLARGVRAPVNAEASGQETDR